MGLFVRKKKDERQRGELSDLHPERVGLVGSPAIGLPFYFLKGGSDVTEKNVAEILAELEAVEEVNVEAYGKVIEFAKGLIEMAAAKTEPVPMEAYVDALSDEDKESLVKLLTAEDGDGDGGDELPAEFAEKFREIESKLESEQKAREKAEARFAESERARRLREFGDAAAAEYDVLATGESFAEDMLALHDAQPEAYGRLVEVLKAANEAVKQGELYAQASNAAKPTDGGDPFLVKVEQIRAEKFADKPYAVGFADALKLAMTAYPELQAVYEARTAGR